MQKNDNTHRSSWTARKIYVDIETAEALTAKEVKENYIILKKTRNVRRAKLGNGGIIEWVNECQRNKQGKLNFNNTSPSRK